MIASRTTTRQSFAPVTLAGYLQLAGLLLGVIALREIQVAGVRPLLLFTLLTGVVTLSGAAIVRRRWKRSTPSTGRVAELARNVSAAPVDAVNVGLRGDSREAAMSPISVAMWTWPKRPSQEWLIVPLPVARENRKGMRIRSPK